MEMGLLVLIPLAQSDGLIPAVRKRIGGIRRLVLSAAARRFLCFLRFGFHFRGGFFRRRVCRILGGLLGRLCFGFGGRLYFRLLLIDLYLEIRELFFRRCGRLIEAAEVRRLKTGLSAVARRLGSIAGRCISGVA